MKYKLLIIAGLFFAAHITKAEEVTLNVNDATDIKGEFVEEKPAEGSSSGQAAHYQPLESLKLGDFSFVFDKAEATTAPAYYYAMSTAATQQSTIRTYKKSIMTIIAPAGTVITGLSATGTNVGDELLAPSLAGLNSSEVIMTNPDGKNMQFKTLTISYEQGEEESKKTANLAWSETKIEVENIEDFISPTFTKATTAPVSFESSDESVAHVDSSGLITLSGKEGESVITAYAEANDEYYAGSASVTISVVGYNYYIPAKGFVGDKSYLVVAIYNGDTYYALPLGETKTYGYLSSGKVDGEVEEIRVKTKYDDEFRFEDAGDGSYYILDCYNRYMIQQGTYKSFNLSSDKPTTGWNVSAGANGTYEISMNGYMWQFGQAEHTTFGCWDTPQDGAVKPMLFEKRSSGIDDVVLNQEEESGAVYYNIQGVRVENPAKGLYIKVQNNKAKKVIIR